MTAFFKSIKLDVVADFYAKQRAAEVTRYTSSRLRDLVEKSESNEEVGFPSGLSVLSCWRPKLM